jgi:hypothetical protein
MVNGGADWYTIGETLGRTVGACKARYSMIENKASPPQVNLPKHHNIYLLSQCLYNIVRALISRGAFKVPQATSLELRR